MAQEAGAEMISRLEWMKITPKVIVDAGCGLGEVAVLLAEKFPAATVTAVDLSPALLKQVPQMTNLSSLLENAANLPFKDHTVDLICANFLLPWVEDVNVCLREWRRVLAPDGLIMLSTLGVGTLSHMQAAMPEKLPRLLDMHDLGDAMVSAGFADPVLDTVRNPVRYRDVTRMQTEWCASGLLLEPVDAAILNPEVVLEVVHAHAFAPPVTTAFKADETGVVKIPLSHLRRPRGEFLGN